MGSVNKAHRRFYTGQTGEYYVLFRLSEASLLASLAPPGSPQVDILVSDLSNHVVATIQVKTRAPGRNLGWLIKSRDTKRTSDFHFFVFVDLEHRTAGMPTSYVVPSKIVADMIRRIHIKDEEIRRRVDPGLFPISRAPKTPIDIYHIVPILHNPPPELTKYWMTDRFLDAYELINLPIFRYKSGPRAPGDDLAGQGGPPGQSRA